MRRAGAWAVAVAVLAVSLSGSSARVGETPAPHGFMDDEERCIDCHQMERDGEDWLLDAHLFTVSVVAACRGCHPEEEMGRSHSVDVDPRNAAGMKEVPEELPLQWSDDARTDVMTCGTCHNPHLDRTSPTKLWSRQRPAEGGMYLTYYLRLRGATPREGFTPLCHACHRDL